MANLSGHSYADSTALLTNTYAHLGTSSFRHAVADLDDLSRRGGRIVRTDRRPDPEHLPTPTAWCRCARRGTVRT